MTLQGHHQGNDLPPLDPWLPVPSPLRGWAHCSQWGEHHYSRSIRPRSPAPGVCVAANTRKSVYVEKGLRHKVGGLLNRKSVYIVKRLRHKVGGLLNRKSVYVVMTTDTEGFTASRFYSLSLTFSCLNFPVVFSRWTSDFWRGNCSCSACIKNTSVQEYNLDYMVQELYVVFSNSNWQWRYVHKMCSTLYSILFKFI